jgi:hypothetical protein
MSPLEGFGHDPMIGGDSSSTVWLAGREKPVKGGKAKMSKQALLREAERNVEQKDELQQSAEGKVRHAFRRVYTGYGVRVALQCALLVGWYLTMMGLQALLAKQAWRAALLRADNVKVLDDPKLLRRWVSRSCSESSAIYKEPRSISLKDKSEFAPLLVMRLCVLACSLHVIVSEVWVVGRECRSVKKEQKEKQKKRQQWKERSSRQEQDKQSRQAK